MSPLRLAFRQPVSLIVLTFLGTACAYTQTRSFDPTSSDVRAEVIARAEPTPS